MTDLQKRPLRVGIYVRYFPPDFGGHGMLIHRTLPFLRQQGVEGEVLAMKLASDPHEVPRGEVRRFLARGEAPAQILRRLVRLRAHLYRSAHRYDVFHSAVPGWDFLLNIGLLRARGVPVVWEMNLMGGNDPASIASYRWGRRKIELLKQADAWAAVSGGFLPGVVKVGFPTERFHAIHGGVDTDAYRPIDTDGRTLLRRRLGLPADARLVVSVGSVIPRKGFDRVLRAWRATNPRPERDLLLIVGPNRAEDRLAPAEVRHAEEIRAAADSPDMSGTVRLEGRVDNVADFLRAADAFVFLSRREGLGLVIIEAMACGLPCIVSPLDGIAAEMVTQGETGFIVEDADDAAAVAGPLGRLLEDPELRRRQGAAGREVALARFSLQARAEATAALYRALAARRTD